MMLPDPPPTFRQPAAAERPWWWRLENSAGTEVTVVEEFADQRFSSQADATVRVDGFAGSGFTVPVAAS